MSNLPYRARPHDPLARFRRKIGENARAWLAFAQAHRPESADLGRELANLDRAANQALLEPTAWPDGLALVVALWPFIEWHGYWLAWREVLDRALVVCRRLDDLAVEVEITDELGELARSLGENPAALAWQEQALNLARRLGNQAVIGRVLVHLSQQYLPQGQYSAAKACCEEAIALLEPLGAGGEIASAYNNWGITYLEEGLMTPALAYLVLAESMFDAQGNRRGQAKAIHNQGETYLRQGLWAEAEPLYERSIALATAAGDELGAVRSRASLATLLHEQGQHETALGINHEIERFYRRLGDRRMLARVINNQGAFFFKLSRWEEADQAFEQAAQIHLESGNLGEAATSVLNGAEILLDRGAREEALTRLQRAAEILDAMSSPWPDERQRHAALLGQAMDERSE